MILPLLAQILIGTIILAAGYYVTLTTGISFGTKKENKGNEGLFESPIKTTVFENYAIPSDRKLQVVGAEFQHKNSIDIINQNGKTFKIDNSGKIDGVTTKDFPLFYSFKEPIINGSYLFKDVKFLKIIDLSKMNSSLMMLLACSKILISKKFILLQKKIQQTRNISIQQKLKTFRRFF